MPSAPSRTATYDPPANNKIKLTERANFQCIIQAFITSNRTNIEEVIGTQFSMSTSTTFCSGASECLVRCTVFRTPNLTWGTRRMQLGAKFMF